MAFEKITDTSLANKGVTGLPDVPGLSTAEMQAKFDELSRDVIIPKLNEIVDGLNGDEVGLSSKIENPETKEKDVIQNVVNAIYQIVKENSDKRHVHENKETLDKVTAELYDSINALVSMFNGISAVDKTVTADDTKIPTSGAIVNYVTELGAGDMQKAVYDKNNTGIVDDAEKLGGVAPEEYLQKAQMITTKEDLLATKVTGYVPDAKAVADTYTELNSNLENHKQSNATTLVTISTDGSYSLNEDYDHYKTILVQTFLEGYLLTDFTIPSTLLKQRNKQGNDLVLTYNDGTIRKAQIYFPTTKTCTTRLMSNVTTLKVYGIDKI